MSQENFMSLEDLEGIILDRKENMPEKSYTANLFIAGTDRIAQKVGEEGVEVAIAATRMGITGEGEEQLVGEISDLYFHSLVLMADLGIPFARIRQELTLRHAEKSK